MLSFWNTSCLGYVNSALYKFKCGLEFAIEHVQIKQSKLLIPRSHQQAIRVNFWWPAVVASFPISAKLIIYYASTTFGSNSPITEHKWGFNWLLHTINTQHITVQSELDINISFRDSLISTARFYHIWKFLFNCQHCDILCCFVSIVQCHFLSSTFSGYINP